MQGAHYFPSNLGTDILLKYQDIDAEIFNRNIITHYIVADELEAEFALKDQSLMTADSRYEPYGLVRCCGFL